MSHMMTFLTFEKIYEWKFSNIIIIFYIINLTKILNACLTLLCYVYTYITYQCKNFHFLIQITIYIFTQIELAYWFLLFDIEYIMRHQKILKYLNNNSVIR